MKPTPRFLKWLLVLFAGITLCAAGSKAPAQIGDDVLRFEGHTLLVTTVAFSPDGKRLLVQSGDGITIHDATTGKRLTRLEEPRSAHGRSAFSPEGKFVAGVVDFQLNVWDSVTGKRVFQSPSREIYGNDEKVIAYSPDGKLVATPELILTVNDGVKVARFTDSEGRPLRLESRAIFSPDGQSLFGIAQVGGNKSAVLCRLPKGLSETTAPLDAAFDTDAAIGKADDIALSVDGKILASLRGRAVVARILGGGTQPEINCDALEFRPVGIAIHPNGKTIAVGGSTSVQLFDTASGKTTAVFDVGKQQDVNSLAFSPDGSRMALGIWKVPSVVIWDVAAGLAAKIAAQEAAAKEEAERLAEMRRKEAELQAKRAEEKRLAEIEAAALRERRKKEAAEREAREAEARRIAEVEAAARREQMKQEAAEREEEARRTAQVESSSGAERMRREESSATTAKLAELFDTADVTEHEGPQQMAKAVDARTPQVQVAEPEAVKADRRAKAAAVVRRLIGQASDHYEEFGYKGVRLGQLYKEINAQRPLDNYGEHTGFPARYEYADTGESFFFDDKDRLVIYGRRYEGGADDYLEQLVELFGKTDKDRIRESDESPANGQSKVTYTTIDYTFSRVLARVVFSKQSLPQGVLEFTHVFVADRKWVEEALARTADDKLKAIGWLRAAADLVRQDICDVSEVPPIPGTRTVAGEGESRFLEFIDTQREADLKPEWGNDSTKLATCAGLKCLRGDPPSVYFDCFRYSGTRLAAKVKVEPGGNDDDDYGRQQFPEMVEPIQTAPILNDWLWRLNQILLEDCFPSADGKVLRQRQSDGFTIREWVEWTSIDSARNSWRVVCGKKLAMRVEYLGKRKL